MIKYQVIKFSLLHLLYNNKCLPDKMKNLNQTKKNKRRSEVKVKLNISVKIGMS